MTQAAQATAASEHEDVLCTACGHRMPAHDTTAARYCAATEASGAVRGCLCPASAGSAGAQPLRTTQPFR